jgi:hypothetical protein
MPEDLNIKAKTMFDRQYKMAIEGHDKYLDIKGPVGKDHRCFSLPFDAKLRKKKKYREARKNPNKKVEKQKEIHPLFHHEENMNLKDNNFYLCKEGEKKWRTPKLDQKLKCFNLHHGDPYLRLGPFKLEEKNQDPFVVVFRDIMSDKQIKHYQLIAQENLSKSTYGAQEASEIRGIFRLR